MTSVKTIGKSFKSFAEVFFYLLIIIIVLKSFVIDFHRVNSNSMTPVLIKNDIIIINKTYFKLGFENFHIKINDIENNDIVVFKNHNQHNIKRIRGLPGDDIFIRKFNNNTYYSLHSDLFTVSSNIIPGKGDIVDINRNNINLFYYHLISENDNYISDTNEIIFKQHKFKNNYYFAVGDNTNLSFDSRNYGLINENRIIGKPLLIIKSDSTKRMFKWIH